MKYKCIKIEEFQDWIHVGGIYDAEIAVESPHLAGYLKIKKADDGNPVFIKSDQFIALKIGSATEDKLGV